MSLLLFAFGLSYGSGISIDHVDGLYGTSSDSIETDVPVIFYLRITNDSGYVFNVTTNGFRIYSPDGATWNGTVPDTIYTGWSSFWAFGFYVNTFSIDGVGADTIGFGGVGGLSSGPGLPAGFNDVVYSITIGPIDTTNHRKTVCIDSSFYPPIGEWLWGANAPNNGIYPSWDGPHCYTIINPNAPVEPSNIILSTDSLEFIGYEGGTNPSSQSFNVLSDKDPLSFTVSENSSWFSINPSGGTTPQTINVSVNTLGLSTGSYLDSIQIVAPDAGNTPQWVKIALIVEPPPPVIEVTPDSVFFNAVAGGSNPPQKFLTITNTGGSSLNWSVSNSETWLSLSPLSGVDSGGVTLSVDITGLLYGDYIDTVTISDPNATNNPVKVPIFLTVGSDLPLIDVDSSFNYIIVPSGVTSIPPRNIVINNAGAGTMSFWLEENSPRIFTLNPSSGIAPQTVEVGFKAGAGQIGNDYFDTLWVYSDQATNAPYPVVFFFHYVDNPAEIEINSIHRDTLVFNVFECTMGANVIMPVDYFTVINAGGDDPMSFKLDYESDLFNIDIDSGIAPTFITATASNLTLSQGTYYDTILVTAKNAINSPETLFVQYNVSPGITPPEIYLAKDNYVIPTRENEGPIPPFTFIVENRFGGCMEWKIQENVPWLYPNPDSGNVPGAVTLNADATGYVFGQYTDSFLVVAPSATNSPRKVSLLLKVWRLAGDVDYNNKLNASDLYYFVQFMFSGGPAPQPEWRVGDVNCDHSVDAGDIFDMIKYFFQNGPALCGNPN